MTREYVYYRYKLQLQKKIDDFKNIDKPPDEYYYESIVDMKLFSLIDQITFEEFADIRDEYYWECRDLIRNEYGRKEMLIDKIEQFLINKTKNKKK